MKLKEFIVSKYGALSALVLGAGAGAGTGVAIAESLKPGLYEKGWTDKANELMSEAQITDMSAQEFYNMHVEAYENIGVEAFGEVVKNIDAAGLAAEATAYYQPQTILGFAGVLAAIGAGYLIVRHQMKKSMAKENNAEIEK